MRLLHFLRKTHAFSPAKSLFLFYALVLALALPLTLSLINSPQDIRQNAQTPATTKTTQTSQWNPASPDPSGLAFNPKTNGLIVSDGEVDEMPIYKNANVFEATLTGSLQKSSNTLKFSPEATGVAVNPTNGHWFFTDDDQRAIFEVDLGADGQLNTADDVVKKLNAANYGVTDAEGVAYGAGKLFIADGLGQAVETISPGPNGIFDGGGDDTFTKFSTSGFGQTDPEGIDYNPDNNTLFIVSHDNKTSAAEVSLTGQLVRNISISALSARAPAGIAYAPSSTDPSKKSIYIVDRGVDNNTDPNENDGKLYEVVLTTTVTPTAPVPSNTPIIPTFACGGSTNNICPTTTPTPGSIATVIPTTPVVSPVPTGITPPAPTLDPCENAVVSVASHKNKHKNKGNGAVRGITNSILELLINLLNFILKLLGGQPITLPTNPGTPQPTTAPQPTVDPGQPQPTNLPDPTEEPGQPMPTTNPCPPTSAPTQAVPTQAQPTSVSTTAPTQAVPTQAQPTSAPAAANFYVSPTGNDANDGSLARPFKTIQKGADAASAGQTVYFRGGTYVVPSQVNFTKSGSNGNPIKYFAYPGEIPIIDGTNVTQRQIVYVTGSWVHLKGFEITKGRIISNGVAGINVVNNNNVTLEQLNVHHNGWYGIQFSNSKNGLVLNNDSHHNLNTNYGDADGFVFYLNSTVTAKGNRSWRNDDDGYDCWDGGVVTFEGNWAFENGYTDNMTPTGDGNGFKLGRGSTTKLLKNNIAWHNKQTGFDFNGNSALMTLYNNTSINNVALNYRMSKALMRNNISLGGGGNTWGSADMTGNSWTLPVTVSDADFESVDGNLLLSPRKADGSLPTVQFAKLVDTSDLIDKGTNVGLPFLGSAPDLGAYEKK